MFHIDARECLVEQLHTSFSSLFSSFESAEKMAEQINLGNVSPEHIKMLTAKLQSKTRGYKPLPTIESIVVGEDQTLQGLTTVVYKTLRKQMDLQFPETELWQMSARRAAELFEDAAKARKDKVRAAA